MHRIHALALLAAITVVGGGAFVACSSSSDGGSTDGGVQDTGAIDDSPTTDSGAQIEGGGDCGSSPTLHPNDAGVGPFCLGVDGGDHNCPMGNVCCQTASGSSTPSTCVTAGSSCPTGGGDVTWECDDPSMCSGGLKCCGFGAPTPIPGCSYAELSPALGTHCVTSCGSGEFVACAADTDCPSGQTCTPLKEGTKQIGYCK